MDKYRSLSTGKSLTQIMGASGLFVGMLCAPSLVRADNDLFVSFFNNDTVALFDGTTGASLNPNFAAVQSPFGLAVGPDHNLYVASDNLSGEEGAGIASFGINGTTGTPLGTFTSHVDAGNGALNTPAGITFQGGNLYVADINASTVFVYGFATAHTGTLIQSLPNDLIVQPIGLHAASNGKLYIANEGQGTVLSYSGGTVTALNSSVLFNGVTATALGADGNLYVLDVSSSSGGLYRLSLGDGTATKLVDYSTSPFIPADLALGPDGNLYVSGVDENQEGEILKYGLDGSGGTVFADTGFETSPGFITFDVPEPTTLSLAGLAAALLVLKFRRSNRDQNI